MTDETNQDTKTYKIYHYKNNLRTKLLLISRLFFLFGVLLCPYCPRPVPAIVTTFPLRYEWCSPESLDDRQPVPTDERTKHLRKDGL